ncbi:hypothetical protein CMI44_01730 [Candidatus Pacearchaeota archaeon]|jgi:large subunit ribosomal protein L31e|nr:hypothetical protein [Candidatus Pacearchaeota archaeon]|tara:strand:+ start:229 stop:816 length:588 start_codon:yes stop_codon:yes gene_type:complete
MATKKPKPKIEKVEREYVIPLRRETQKIPKYKKANRAVKTIKVFLVKHMKIYDRDLKKIKIDKYLNEFVWFRGIKKPPAKIRVKAVKEGDIIQVELAELPTKLKFKKLREEKIEAKAKEAINKKKTLKEKVQDSVRGKPGGEKKTEEEKEEEKEKVKAGAEATKQLEKLQAKQMKTQTGGKAKQKTQPKRMALEK